MKKLYEFTAYKEINKDGAKSYVPHKFFFRRPNRGLIDDAELFYSVEFNNNVKLGLLTKAQLATKFSDEISTFSEKDKERYIKSYTSLSDLQVDYQTKLLKKKEERTQEEQANIEDTAKKIIEITEDMQRIEASQQSLFDHTAEVRARNRTVLWWTFNLGYFEDGKPFFGEGNFSTKLNQYDAYDEDEDSFLISVARKMTYLISFWYAGRVETKEEFDKAAEIVGINVNPNDIKKKEDENASPPVDAHPV